MHFRCCSLHVSSPYVYLLSLMFLLFVFIPYFFETLFWISFIFIFFKTNPFFIRSSLFVKLFLFDLLFLVVSFSFIFNLVLSNKITWPFFFDPKSLNPSKIFSEFLSFDISKEKKFVNHFSICFLKSFFLKKKTVFSSWKIPFHPFRLFWITFIPQKLPL